MRGTVGAGAALLLKLFIFRIPNARPNKQPEYNIIVIQNMYVPIAVYLYIDKLNPLFKY